MNIKAETDTTYNDFFEGALYFGWRKAGLVSRKETYPFKKSFYVVSVSAFIFILYESILYESISSAVEMAEVFNDFQFCNYWIKFGK